MKKISIITVVKNGMPYLKNAIESFDKQEYLNKEHVIVFSKSNDGTEQYLETQKSINRIIIEITTLVISSMQSILDEICTRMLLVFHSMTNFITIIY